MSKKFTLSLILLIFIFQIQSFAGTLEINNTELGVPRNLTVEVKTYDDDVRKGIPYFVLRWNLAPETLEIINYELENGESDFDFEIDYKIGDSPWIFDIDGRNSLYTGNQCDSFEKYDKDTDILTCIFDPINEGILDTVDIKENKYSFRIRYSYYKEINDTCVDIFSPFSEIVSAGIGAYYKKASSWAIKELNTAQEYGFISDSIQNNISAPITREEFCEIAVLFYEKITEKKALSIESNMFTDCTNPEVLKAVNLGITKGVGNNKFEPDKILNREQMATMITRSIEASFPDVSISVDGVNKFDDQTSISSWAINSTKFMYKYDITKGIGNNKFGPKVDCTREQAVIFLTRAFEKKDSYN